MVQKIIKVGNSYAMTIPMAFVQELHLQVGQQVRVSTDSASGVLTMRTANPPVKRGDITPEFLTWLDTFNAKYKHVLRELAKK